MSEGTAVRSRQLFAFLYNLDFKYKLRQLPESLEQFDKVLALAPNHIAAINERGSVLAEMKQYNSALTSFEKALKLQPLYPEAWPIRAMYWAI
jgi:tetratricopeptide (TPR) repeat protein